MKKQKYIKTEMVVIPKRFTDLMDKRLEFIDYWFFKNRSITQLLYMAYIQGMSDAEETLMAKI